MPEIDLAQKHLVTMWVDTQFLLDQMTTAIEGGCNYWLNGHCNTFMRDKDLNVTMIDIAADKGNHPAAIVRPDDIARAINMLGAMVQRAKAGKKQKTDMESAARHLAAIITDAADAETADVLVQLAAFGKLIYG